MYEHETYVLPNKPNGFGNDSLPSDLFFEGKPKKIAKYFVHDYAEDNLPPNFEIKTEKTLLTFQIDTKRRLKLHFLPKTFQHEIVINAGQIEINMPYVIGTPEELVFIEILPWLKKNMAEELKFGK